MFFSPVVGIVNVEAEEKQYLFITKPFCRSSATDYYKLLNEFNHIGNNLNQIAKSLNSRQDKSSFIVEITIEELRNMIKNLDEKVRGD